MNLRLTRRSFVVGAGAFVALHVTGAECPLWSAGIVTDTHVRKDRASCGLVEKACELFAERNVDLFVNCGDIANTYTPEIYPVLKELTDAAFPSKPPQKIFGHAHSSLRSELNVWQGEFTAVSMGCLERWQGEAVAFVSKSPNQYSCQ